MDDKLFDNIYKYLSYRLLSKSFLKNNYHKKDLFKNYMEQDDFKEKLKTMSDNDIFSCHALLSLLENLLNELTPNPPDDWLYYIYEYTLNKSFPHAVKTILSPDLDFPCYVYLQTLRILSQLQKISTDESWQSKYPLNFLSKKEIANLEDPSEYKSFVKAFNNSYMYELMKLNTEVIGHKLLDHVCAVHYLAMFISRQIKDSNLNIDLGIVSGATMGHDIGKLGCTSDESKKVAYLHYYYTDLWFSSHNLEYIRNIATNHSVWDLELDNLSLESLILIYCDFRVKRINKLMSIVSIDDAFSVILNKLDNVDYKKQRRYERVYTKLRDFEDFLLDKNIQVNLEDTLNKKIYDKKLYSLMRNKEVINNLKYLSINSNINLMDLLKTEFSLDFILKSARSENNYTNLRKYLKVFEEYSNYLTQGQKKITLNFLYELLTHHKGDIRYTSARIIGKLIGHFDMDYRKEIPKKFPPMIGYLTSKDLLNKYINMFLYPDHKIVFSHRKRIKELFGVMIKSFFENAKSTEVININTSDYIEILSSSYNQADDDILLYLIDATPYIPFIHKNFCSDVIVQFLFSMCKHKNYIIRVNGLYNLNEILKFKTLSTKHYPSINLLVNKTYDNLSLIEKYLYSSINTLSQSNFYNNDFNLSLKEINHLTLSNLKSTTDWVVKKAQIHILLDYALNNETQGEKLKIALHFCNILKVNSYKDVRFLAGDSLIQLINSMPYENRNEISIELFSALELSEFQFSENIAHYLGQIILSLRPKELDEFIQNLHNKVKVSNEKITTLYLITISIAIEHYKNYTYKFKDKNFAHEKRLFSMISILLTSLSHYKNSIRQASIEALGKNIFGTITMSLHDKYHIFKRINKKLLTLIKYDSSDILDSLSNTFALNHIYNFICDYTFFYGDFNIVSSNKVAFFPGTFDPFSLSHKEIAMKVRDLGYEVYLAVDEFSWSKRTLPHKLRKNIVDMSIAGELDIYIYPEDYPTNLTNKLNLLELKNNFKDCSISIVVGSDVILNASAYKKSSIDLSIKDFDHIIFNRNKDRNLKDAISLINGNSTIINLNTFFEEISSSLIRSNIDKNRDISSLIDPIAQSYIYDNGFYRSEPENKPQAGNLTYDIQTHTNFTNDLLEELSSLFSVNHTIYKGNLIKLTKKTSTCITTIKDLKDDSTLLGFCIHHSCELHNLFKDIENPKTCKYIRKKALGKIALIDGLIVNNLKETEKIEQILLTETLAYCLSVDYEYGIYKNSLTDNTHRNIHNNLILQGFKKLNFTDSKNPTYVVNMSYPITYYSDINALLKMPFKNNSYIKSKIEKNRKNIRKALTNLYDGHLVITFDKKVLHDHLIKKVCAANKVSPIEVDKSSSGKCVCVSFGNMLNESIIPNTVTKAMHTEKMFYPDMKNNFIGPFPYYNDLDIQVKMIKAFNRPVILIDDILHKGYRNNTIHPLLTDNSVIVEKTIVGILSARGREIMYRQNRSIDSAYYIPKLRAWFNESLMLPFFGGDTLWRDKMPKRNLIPSINFILPYAWPHFIKGTSKNNVYNLSKTCIESSIDILEAIEHVYHSIYKKNLSLSSLGEVFISPRCIDYGDGLNYNLNLNPSHYLYNDLDKLERYYKLFF